MRSRFLIIAIVNAAVVAVACGGGGASGSGSNSSAAPYPTGSNPATPTATVPANTMIATNQLTFNPSDLTVARGTTVAFVVQDTTHQLYFTGTGKPADLPATQNTTQTRLFDNAGSYGVYCRIHAYMRGTITVQ